MISLTAAAVLGLLAWSFVEYLVHGILSHRYQTFVTPLHGTHHKDPRAVFTSPAAWVPAAIVIFAATSLATGLPLAGAFTGLLLGFGRYEYCHWRITSGTPVPTTE